jgi:hypothetical protein
MNTNDKVKTKAILICLFLFLARSHGSAAGQVDPRFDGLWSGTELIQGHFAISQLGGGQKPGQVSAVIAISDSGKSFGVVQGLTPGLYDVSPKSDGNTLIFRLHEIHPKGSHGVFLGRTEGKLILSADGYTLTEHASAILQGMQGGRGRIVNCIVVGTFHRLRKG